MKRFTKETLSNYNGKNGRPAYIAVNGIVYDVTNNSSWINGEHNGTNAGQDISQSMSSHGKKVLTHIDKVGIYDQKNNLLQNFDPK